MRRGLTKDWSIELDGDYDPDVVNGQLRFMVPGRTIWLRVWTKPGLEMLDTLTWIKAAPRQAHPHEAG